MDRHGLSARARWLFAGLGRYPRYAWRLLTRPARMRLHGIVLELGPDTTPALRRALYSERYERGEARCVLLRVEPDDVVLEIGAGLGFLSTLCALRVGSENATAYEANPALLPRIRATYAANGVAPQLVNAVLARKAGEADLYVEGEFVSSSLLRRSETATRVRVPQHAVSDVIARVNPSCLVIDIEGGEVELLPAIDLRGVRKLILELHPQRIGETRAALLVTWLTAQGLREDRAISSTRKKYFARGAS